MCMLIAVLLVPSFYFKIVLKSKVVVFVILGIQNGELTSCLVECKFFYSVIIQFVNLFGFISLHFFSLLWGRNSSNFDSEELSPSIYSVPVFKIVSDDLVSF